MRVRRASMRGYTLLEMMVAIALVGILAAIGAPSLLPEARRAQIDAAAEQVASFVGRARTEAMLSKRCVRVRLTTLVATGQYNALVAERLNTFDCGDSFDAAETVGTAPLVDTTTTARWITIATMKFDRTKVRVAWDTTYGGAPDELDPPAAKLDPSGSDHELRYRPNGRMWGELWPAWSGANAAALTTAQFNDDGVMVVSHSDDTAVKRIVFDGNGLICVLERGAAPTANANGGYDCP